MHHDPLEPHEEHDEPESKAKKIFLYILGVVLVILTISYIFVSFPIGRIIEGQVESHPLDNNIIQADNTILIFENNIHKEIQQIYFDNQKTEFSACLQGYKQGQEYHITDFYLPVMYRQTFNHVSFEPCEDTLILFHTHPYKSCVASETDINTLRRTQASNPDTLMVVMCEPERFSVYS